MHGSDPFLEMLMLQRFFVYQGIITRRSNEDWLVYFSLREKERERYDRKVNRWRRGQLDGPFPTIPGTRSYDDALYAAESAASADEQSS